MSKTIFVTVGTTLFERLVAGVTSAQALAWMEEHGFTHLIVQYGKGRKPQVLGSPSTNGKLNIELYDFKPTLTEDMAKADLIISHAGAGTVMECLRIRKRAVIVINDLLMHNHQTELAHAMGSRDYVYVLDSPDLLRDTTTWDKFSDFTPSPYPEVNEKDFPFLLDAFMGFTT